MTHDFTRVGNLQGIVAIDRVVAEFKVWLAAELFPVPYMKVKVLQRSNDYIAISNLNRCDSATGSFDGIAGLGNTADDALRDLLTRFVSDAQEVAEQRQLVEAGFIWSDSDDF